MLESKWRDNFFKLKCKPNQIKMQASPLIINLSVYYLLRQLTYKRIFNSTQFYLPQSYTKCTPQQVLAGDCFPVD